jgi:thiamine pyrophosphate-dependent acetolactate synthase large subunit-like protein
MAAPERPSLAYVGDGAWGMSLNEMLTWDRFYESPFRPKKLFRQPFIL